MSQGPLLTFLADAPRFLFFTGKGGVGKTTLSCATALALAEAGRRVLLISTDPASNLDEVLEQHWEAVSRPLAAVPTLSALNIDPVAAATAYRERMVEPYRATMPPALLASIEEQFSGACTTEIAAFDEFARYLGDPELTADYDQVIFDTAPTGHTLRLLTLPSAWDGFLSENTSGATCLGPLAGLQQQQALYARALAALQDGVRTRLALVTRPEQSAITEAERSRCELADLGITELCLLVNGLYAAEPGDALALAWKARQQRALSGMPAGLAALPRLEIPLQAGNAVGLDALRMVAGRQPLRPVVDAASDDRTPEALPALANLVDALAARGRGVVLVMGKGGVGKTTLAAAVAVALAARGLPVHLSTTDPAAHLQHALCEAVPGLSVGRIDPEEEVARYRREVMAQAGAGLDGAGRALLEEDLRSPCTEEIAVFRAFAETVDRGRESIVVLDTAPTGHTLLLLDASQAYHREVARAGSELPAAVQELLPRLRDPDFCAVILATLPEPTPVHEARQLAGDLARAGISPWAWVVNHSLTPLTLADALLRRRRAAEAPCIEEVRSLAERWAVVGVCEEEPTGAAALQALCDD